MVPVLDLSRRAERLRPAFLDAADRVLRSGQLLLGPELEAFEAELARWSGHRHAVAVASGAAALQLAMAAAGVSAGDEVIVPALTAVPTASAVCALGAVPVFADVDAATATLDPAAARAARTEATTAVVPVHLYGRPADVGQLAGIGATIVEDAAQAHGATPGPRPSAAVAYSFYPTKNLGGVGDGGAVCTDDAQLAADVRTLRVHGMADQYVHVAVSQNFRMSELEAAWLRLALADLEPSTARRTAIARHYRTCAPELRWQDDHPSHVHHLCVLRSTDRPAAVERLGRHGVATAVHYPLALTQQPAYRHLATAPCPTAESWARECITVPCFPEMTDAEVEHVAAAVRDLAQSEAGA